jgi:peptide alpha-N-acetyltransferase
MTEDDTNKTTDQDTRPNNQVAKPTSVLSDLQYVQYEPSQEEQYLPAIRQLISKDLSEPYSIYVYRYFLYQWGDLCYMVNQLTLSISLSTPIPLVIEQC